MEAFICGTCQTLHKYGDINTQTYCDSCKQLISGHKFQCTVCMYSNDESENESQYHKNCVTKLEGAWYCQAHKAKKLKIVEASKIIQKYAEGFWEELGGKVTEFSKAYSNRKFKVDFEVLTLTVNLTPVSKNGDVHNDNDLEFEILSLKHEVFGIKNQGSATYQAGIHSHQDALEQVASAMIRSLRSKKSALTVESNAIKAEYSGLTVEEQKDYYGSVKKCLNKERTQLSIVGKKRKKINDLSKFLVDKLASFKKVQTEQLEPVLV